MEEMIIVTSCLDMMFFSLSRFFLYYALFLLSLLLILSSVR